MPYRGITVQKAGAGKSLAQEGLRKAWSLAKCGGVGRGRWGGREGNWKGKLKTDWAVK